MTLSSGILNIVKHHRIIEKCVAVDADPRQCYYCGHKIVGNETETETIGDMPFCADFANPIDNLKKCRTDDDCCAVMKELHQM